MLTAVILGDELVTCEGIECKGLNAVNQLARELIGEGHDPETVIQFRRLGNPVAAFSGKLTNIGRYSYTYEEDKNRWTPHPKGNYPKPLLDWYNAIETERKAKKDAA